MDPGEEKKVFEDAMRMWGTVAQFHMTIEESSELIKAICKWLRAHDDTELHERTKELVDELADVSIMVDQLKLEVGQEPFDRARDLKMRRLAGKLEKYRETHRLNPEMPWPTRIDLDKFM